MILFFVIEELVALANIFDLQRKKCLLFVFSTQTKLKEYFLSFLIVFASVLLSFNGYRSNMCKKAIKKFRFIDFTCERMFGWFNPRGVLSDLTQRGHRDNLKDTLRANPYRDLSIFMVPLLSIFKLFRAIAYPFFHKTQMKNIWHNFIIDF